MGYVWLRGIQASSAWQVGNAELVSISAGETYVRYRFRWGFYADTPVVTNMSSVANNLLTWGLVTTIGNGTETVPNARTASGNASPPAERWLYWETRAPIVGSISEDAGVIAWRDSGSSELTDSKGQVLAPPMIGGDSLNLWASWAAPFAWDLEGSTVVWFGWEVLVKT